MKALLSFLSCGTLWLLFSDFALGGVIVFRSASVCEKLTKLDM